MEKGCECFLCNTKTSQIRYFLRNRRIKAPILLHGDTIIAFTERKKKMKLTKSEFVENLNNKHMYQLELDLFPYRSKIISEGGNQILYLV